MKKGRNFAVISVALMFLALTMAVSQTHAMELKAGLDVKGQWKRGDDIGVFARLKIFSIEGNKARLAYAVGRFGYDEITKDSFDEINGEVSESSPGVKVVKFTGGKSLADFVFIFNPGTPFVRGSWTSTRNRTWQIEMK